MLKKISFASINCFIIYITINLDLGFEPFLPYIEKVLFSPQMKEKHVCTHVGMEAPLKCATCSSMYYNYSKLQIWGRKQQQQPRQKLQTNDYECENARKLLISVPSSSYQKSISMKLLLYICTFVYRKKRVVIHMKRNRWNIITKKIEMRILYIFDHKKTFTFEFQFQLCLHCCSTSCKMRWIFALKTGARKKIKGKNNENPKEHSLSRYTSRCAKYMFEWINLLLALFVGLALRFWLWFRFES